MKFKWAPKNKSCPNELKFCEEIKEILKVSDFYLDKQKSFIPKKILSVPCTMDSSLFSQQMAP